MKQEYCIVPEAGRLATTSSTSLEVSIHQNKTTMPVIHADGYIWCSCNFKQACDDYKKVHGPVVPVTCLPVACLRRIADGHGFNVSI